MAAASVPPSDVDVAAQALLEFSKGEDIEAAKELVNMKMLDDAYALFSMKEPIDKLKAHLSALQPSDIEENIQLLIAEGFLPPTDDILYIGDSGVYHEGGVILDAQGKQMPPPKRGREEEEGEEGAALQTTPSKRQRTPSKKIKENLEAIQEKTRQRELAAIHLKKAEEDEARLQELLYQKQEERLKSLKQYEDIPSALKSIDVCAPRSAGLIMKTIFPPQVIDEWTTVRKKKCRDIYELGDIMAQCNNVIEDKPKVCYLCGIPCNEAEDGLQATCEHILPIIQAVFFLELYKPGQKPPFSQAQLLEYGWAHRCCNYIKNDYSFIKTKLINNYPTYQFNSTQVSVTLSIIANTKGKFKGVEIIQSKIGADISGWKSRQIESIKTNQIIPILNYIASKNDNGMAFLVGYRNCLTNENIHRDFLNLLKEAPVGGRKTFRRKYNGKSVRRTTRKSNGANSRTHRKVRASARKRA